MKSLGFSLVTLGCLVGLYFPAYRLRHPKLTEAQVFLELWPIFVLVMVLVVGGALLLRRGMR